MVNGEEVREPRSQYTTQDFDEWLKYFLSRKAIDDALRDTHNHIVNTPLVPGAEIKDVRDSPAYRELYSGVQSPYNLRFALFVDWFPAFKMKPAGTCT